MITSTRTGRADHPRKGDFEAQRFWMDLTVNEKCGVRWYEVGGVGDGDWWRLDCEFSDRVHMGDGAAAKLAVMTRRGVGADHRG